MPIKTTRGTKSVVPQAHQHFQMQFQETQHRCPTQQHVCSNQQALSRAIRGKTYENNNSFYNIKGKEKNKPLTYHKPISAEKLKTRAKTIKRLQ
mgnify:CR=1 FL=1